MIYFDNAATSLIKPACVVDAVTNAMRTLGNPGRGAHTAALDAARTVYAARCSIAKLLGAENPSRIAFMSNATEALNTSLFGLFSPGDHIISTVCEHNSALRPLYLLERSGIHTDYIGTDKNGALEYDEIERLIKPNTKAFIVTHASNVTGNVTDLQFFSELKQKYGLYLVVDGAQSAGSIPVNVTASNIDIFCFTGHKALLGPQGTGGLYAAEGITIRPLKSGGSGIHSYDKLHPSEMPDALEAGTLNCHGIAGLKAAAEYILSVGIDKIHEHETKLAGRFCSGVKSIDNVTVYGDFSGGYRAPVISLNIGGLDPSYVCDILNMEYDIAVRSGAHCAPLMHKAIGTDNRGAVRFSFGIFNTAEEIDCAVNAIKEIAQCEKES